MQKKTNKVKNFLQQKAKGIQFIFLRGLCQIVHTKSSSCRLYSEKG